MNQTVKSKPSCIIQAQPRHSVENKLATATLNIEKRIKTKHQSITATT